MKNFWGSFLGAIVGLLAAAILFSIITVAGISAIFSASDRDAGPLISVKENTVLHIRLDEPVEDFNNPDPFSIFNESQNRAVSLRTFITGLEYAVTDDKVKGLFLEIESVPTGMANSNEILKALRNFKNSGKFIIAYSESMNQSAYRFAALADTIFLNPYGDFIIKGLGAEMLFYRGMLDKLGIEPYAVRPDGNRFKSAVEPFLLDKASPANREQMSYILFEIWNDFTKEVSENKPFGPEQINQVANDLSIVTAREALNRQFAHKLAYRDEVMETIARLAGWSEKQTEKDHLLKFNSYATYADVQRKSKSSSREQIAIVYASGTIIRGEGEHDQIGSESLCKTLNEVREDDKVKAVVLRVNSPGGDALASEIIWHSVQKLKEKKPVVVSMGNVAASGGYYISCGANYIFADAHTITGSIGVFGMFFNARELMKDKIGLSTDTILTNRSADFPTVSRPLHEREKDALQRMVNQVYEDFTGRVSMGRGLDQILVADSLGQGRIWTGRQALARGLVDEIGGLQDAIEYAASLAELQTYSIKELPKPGDPLEALFRSLNSEARVQMEEMGLENLYEVYRMARTARQMKGVQAAMPFELRFIW